MSLLTTSTSPAQASTPPLSINDQLKSLFVAKGIAGLTQLTEALQYAEVVIQRRQSSNAAQTANIVRCDRAWLFNTFGDSAVALVPQSNGSLLAVLKSSATPTAAATTAATPTSATIATTTAGATTAAAPASTVTTTAPATTHVVGTHTAPTQPVTEHGTLPQHNLHPSAILASPSVSVESASVHPQPGIHPQAGRPIGTAPPTHPVEPVHPVVQVAPPAAHPVTQTAPVVTHPVVQTAAPVVHPVVHPVVQVAPPASPAVAKK